MPSTSRPGPDVRSSARQGRRRGPCGPASGPWPSLLPRPLRRPRPRASGSWIAGVEAAAQGLERRLERVDHRLVAGLGRAQLLDRVESGVERREQLRAAERVGVAERLAGPAQGRAPERTAGTADGGDQGLAGDDQEPAGGEESPLSGQRLLDRLEPAVHVDAVVAVSDRGVELAEIVALRPDRRGDRAHPCVDGCGVHCGLGDHRGLALPAKRRRVDGSIPQIGQLLIELEHRQRCPGHLERGDVAADQAARRVETAVAQQSLDVRVEARRARAAACRPCR